MTNSRCHMTNSRSHMNSSRYHMTNSRCHMTNSCLNDVPVVLVLLWVPQPVLLEVHLEKKGPQAIQANQMLSSVLVSIAPKLLPCIVCYSVYQKEETAWEQGY